VVNPVWEENQNVAFRYILNPYGAADRMCRHGGIYDFELVAAIAIDFCDDLGEGLFVKVQSALQPL